MSKNITRVAAVAAVSAIAAGLSTAPATGAPKTKVAIQQADIVVDEAAGTASVTIAINKKAKKKLKLNWATQANPKSAKAGEDFTAVKGRLVFTAGEKEATLVVPILEDTVDEADEFFYIKFNGKAVKVKNPRVKVTITDNDTAPVVTPPPAA